MLWHCKPFSYVSFAVSQEPNAYNHSPIIKCLILPLYILLYFTLFLLLKAVTKSYWYKLEKTSFLQAAVCTLLFNHDVGLSMLSLIMEWDEQSEEQWERGAAQVNGGSKREDMRQQEELQEVDGEKYGNWQGEESFVECEESRFLPHMVPIKRLYYGDTFRLR